MSDYVLDEVSNKASEKADPGRRHKHEFDDTLVLTELNRATVIDQFESESEVLDLITCGSVRELCPKCGETHLQLVLRQRQVRLAHLFCTDCQSRFDAHYRTGVPALTI